MPEDQYLPSTSQHTLPSGVVVLVWSPPTPAAPEAVLVLQHGFSEHSRRYMDGWLPLGPRLLGLGYEIWAMEMWGHGLSPGPRGAVSVDKAVDDHVEVRRLAAERRPGLPIFLLGHSLGGLVTAGSAERRPEGIAGVVLSAPAFPGPVGAASRLVARAGAWLAPGTQVPFMGSPRTPLSRIQEQLDIFRVDPLRFGGQIPFIVAATALDAAERLWAGLDSWSLPTLVMHGTDDSFTEYERSKEFVDKLGARDKRLFTVEGGYHEVLRDLGYEEASELVVSWLEERREKTN